MIKNIIFDLDGVLFDGVKFHKDMFMKALLEINPDVGITEEFHNTWLNGLSTRQKLAYLVNISLIDSVQSEKINKLKIYYTNNCLKELHISNTGIYMIITTLHSMKYKLFCVSNSIRDTCEIVFKN